MSLADPAPVQSRTAHIRRLAKTDPPLAIRELADLLRDVLDVQVSDVQINHDQYSLNSLNGFLTIDAKPYFFKFHQEDGEEHMSGEYYRADLIAKADLPVDMPVLSSTSAGEQILIYRRRQDPRFSDVLRELDTEATAAAIDQAARAERELNAKILAVARSSLHAVTPGQVAAEPINHLFHDRLIDPKTRRFPGGRYADFYVGKTFEFEGLSLEWDDFSTARVVLNGQKMVSTFGEIFLHAADVLRPENMTGAGGFTAHGDAHNANVWYEQSGAEPRLTYFDPAFAGEHIPSLLAEVKATFHNVFAHPFWLYDPALAATRYGAGVRHENGTLHIDTDWTLSEVRLALLAAKAEEFWRPFLSHLAGRDMLPDDWRAMLRSALAMCPALVMNLRAGAERHNPCSSAIAFYVLGLVGSECAEGRNVVSDFLDSIDPARE